MPGERNPRLGAALEYAALGLRVVPGHWVHREGRCSCGNPECTSPGKHPRSRHGYKDATVDPRLLREVWRRSPYANVMIATGPESGIWVLDIDPRHGGADSLAALLDAHGALPETLVAASGGGGWHYFFRWVPDRPVPSRSGALGAGLDIRGAKGVIVAPPSMHASGVAYAWVDGRGPGARPIADPPAWLLDCAQTGRSGAPLRAAPPVGRLGVATGAPSSHPSDGAAERGLPRASAERVDSPSVPAGGGAGGAPSPRRPAEAVSLPAYVEAAFRTEIARVEGATPGTRNETLLAAARALGTLVAAGALGEPLVRATLTAAALRAGLSEPEITRTVESGLGYGLARPRDLTTVVGRSQRPPNAEAQAVRQRRLADNPAALAFVTDGLGLDAETRRHFQLGLDPPYQSRKTGLTRADSLTIPIRSAEGAALGAFCRADIPGVTRNPRARLWSAGEPVTFFAYPQTAQTTAVVVDLLDLLRLWQECRAVPPAERPQFIASTGAERFPTAWGDPAFWQRWRRVVIGLPDRGSAERSLAIARAAGRPVTDMAARAPWLEHFRAGGTIAQVLEAIDTAEPVGEPAPHPASDDQALGRSAYRPVDLGRSYHRGHLYYPVDTLFRDQEIDGNGLARVVERRETMVVRSDGSLLSIVEVPAPRGTPADRRVLRLSDGTLIEERPQSSTAASWSWDAVDGYIRAKKAGHPAATRPLGAIVAEIMAILKATVWLPYEDDHTILALAAVVSFGQAVFDAVPLILLCGEPDSGKSTLGIAMANLSANGSIVGQVSAAAAARLIHETRGLVVLDDLEKIASRSGDDTSFSELVQWLKVSYNKNTAVKVWVDTARGMAVRRLNGFGVKIVNNTGGADGILGSRMIRIQTRKMPAAVASVRAKATVADPARLQAIRDELHTWVFENAAVIDQTYRRLTPAVQDRAEQIAAPLRTFAQLCGEAVSASLEAALARSASRPVEFDDPIALLQEAAATLVRQGFREVNPSHLILEMRRLVDTDFGKRATTDIPEWEQPGWVGRTLRNRDIIDPGHPGFRKRVRQRNLRFYPFSRNFLTEALADPDTTVRDPASFCQGCGGCAYQAVGCTLMEAETRSQRRPRRD
ncbi:bifunctional DNA primase/polymerase [Azospirillum canadense]|uniref:bifunctional DNA primase/polymerase n=1 Tax=Azospirillum canadense TaxID=403962 RepID=UPI002227DEDE|nr:bifunctional DNA primase/polymerase [Azospirillum canadense]MCW2236821.1 DNA-binding transcriptional regulator YdaS (Cro superfamily) [Azospirillum canadense]